MSWDADGIVAGAGNAGFCAAHAAAECGARVLLLEKAPEDWIGGNSYFTAGAIRTVHGGLDDVLPLVEPVDAALAEATELPPYTPEDYRADMLRLTEGRCDPGLVELLVGDSRATLGWLRELGLRLRLMYDRQSYAVGGRHVFWGGLHVGTVDGRQRPDRRPPGRRRSRGDRGALRPRGGRARAASVEPGRNMAGAPGRNRTSRSMRYSRRSGTFGGRGRGAPPTLGRAGARSPLALASDRARRGGSGALSPAIRSSGAESPSEGLGLRGQYAGRRRRWPGPAR